MSGLKKGEEGDQFPMWRFMGILKEQLEGQVKLIESERIGGIREGKFLKKEDGFWKWLKEQELTLNSKKGFFEAFKRMISDSRNGLKKNLKLK